VIFGAEENLESYLREERARDVVPEAEKGGPTPLRRVAAQARRELEREVILKTLKTYNWNRRKTAEALRISYRTLLYKVREAGLQSMRQRKEFYLKNDPATASGASSAPGSRRRPRCPSTGRSARIARSRGVTSISAR